MKFKNLKAVGEWVVIEARKVKEEAKDKVTESGIILPGKEKPVGTNINTSEGKETSRLFIYDIGPDVKNPIFKKGDEVIVDDYDIQVFGDDENIYCLVNSNKIKCVLETE